MSSASSSVLHAYGVVRAGAQVWLPSRGIDEAPVQLVTVNSLAAVVSPLDDTAYGEDAWTEHAEDPRWLGAVALEHQTVLATLVTSADVLPFRLPGMYRDEASLRRVLAEESALLERGLAATADQVEWGVKVFRVDDKKTPPTPRASSGRGYLQQLSERSQRREVDSAARRDLVLRAYGLLADAASHSVTNPPQDATLSGREAPMLLNSAHLVRRGSEEAFFAGATQAQELLSDHGMHVEVTGPWPPYNFVHLGTEELGGDP